ncbi:MAG: hypothetical protein Q9177_000444 [Variospora cf. flavescens]
MLEPSQEDTVFLLFSDPEIQFMCSGLSPPLPVRNLPPTPYRLRLNYLDVFNFTDISCQQFISSSPSHIRGRKTLLTNDDIKSTKVPSNLSLADISPAQFQPGYGYMKAIATRASLIPRIASSICTISSPSRFCSSSQPSPPPQPQLETQNPDDDANKARALQNQLWALLQNQKRATRPLETFKRTDLTVFERCERETAMMFDSDDAVPITNSPERRSEDDDGEDMLDTHQADRWEILEDEQDESLFSFATSDGFCLSSQGPDAEMIFDEDDGDEEDFLPREEASGESALAAPKKTEDESWPWLAKEQQKKGDVFGGWDYNKHELYQDAGEQMLF